MPWFTLVAQILGSAAGEAASQMGKDEAMRLIKSVSDEFGKINLPKLKEMLLTKQADTGLANIKDDPTYRGQQSSADAQLNNIIKSGGLTLGDRAALNRVLARSGRNEAAGRASLEQQLRGKGAGESGAQLAMALESQQRGAELANQQGENAAAQAQERLYRAIQQRGQNAGQGLDRSYRQQSDAARAQDAINAGNTAIMNTAARWNAGLPQQDFENQMKLTAAKAGPTYALGGAHAANAQDTKQMWQGIGNAAGQAGNSGYAAYKENQGGVANLGQDGDTVSVNVDQAFQQQEKDAQGLSGQATRPTRVKEVVGYDDAGRPMYGYRTAT